ncbi:MAG: response regulator [Verrucomicrobiia bacterium]
MTAFRHRLIVLLAEDDENDLLLIRRAFDRLRSFVRLIAIPDGDTAIAYLRGDGKFADRDRWPIPDVVLLDQWLPGTTGLDVLAWIRTEAGLASVPVALISGAMSPTHAQEAGRLRAASCAKGADATEMMEAIDWAMESAQGLACEAWFASRTAYAPLSSPGPDQREAIRLWT